MIQASIESGMSREPLDFEQVSALVDTALGRLLAVSQALAFWATVAFPIIYLGGYVATVVHPGLSVPSAPVIGALLGGNVIAVVVGHRHEPSAAAPAAASPARAGGISHGAD